MVGPSTRKQGRNNFGNTSAEVDDPIDPVLARLETMELKIQKKMEVNKDEIIDRIDEIKNQVEELKRENLNLTSRIDRCAADIKRLEKQQKQKNLILSGLLEKNNESVIDEVEIFLDQKLKIQVKIDQAWRIGPAKSGYNRPIRIQMTNMRDRNEVIKQKKNLRGSNIYIYIKI